MKTWVESHHVSRFTFHGLMDITFKIAETTDIELIVTFMRELNEVDQTPFDEPAARAAGVRFIADTTWGRVWLIQTGGEAVGYVALTLGYSFEYHGQDAFIDELYLKESHRGQGIGRQAIEFVEQICRTLGVNALHLEVERRNTAAHKLYRQAGFEDHDRYLMTKWIGQVD
jgi:GNAT superfamily N-acetyltransferase